MGAMRKVTTLVKIHGIERVASDTPHIDETCLLQRNQELNEMLETTHQDPSYNFHGADGGPIIG